MKGRLRRLSGRSGKKTGLFIALGIMVLAMLGGGAYAAFGGSGQPQASTDIELQRGLVGWWKLDGNPKDSTPYGDNCTNTAATTTSDRKGLASGAYAFNGSTSKLDCGAPAILQAATSLTISAWVYSTNWASSASMNGVVNYGSGGYWLYVATNGSVNFYLQNGSGTTDSFGTTALLSTSAWHHIAATYDGTTESIYIDGALSQTHTATVGTLGNYGSNFLIGTVKSVAGRYMNGSIDDVRIYKRAISATEVKALFTQYNPGVQAASGENGLVGEWKFDGNTKDSTPYGGTATNNGATLAPDRKGAANRAYSFNGTSNYMTVPDSDNLSPATITVSAWVKWNGGGTNNIVSKNGNNEYRYRINSGGTITVFDRGATNALTTTATISSNTWYLLSFTGDSSGLKIYINGQLSTSNATAYAPPNTSGLLYFGTYTGTSEFMTGSIDDIRIYNRVLSAAELLSQYNSYDSQVNLNANPSNTLSAGNINAGLIGYWPLNGNAKDATPYGNNGAPVGSLVFTTDRKGRANSAYSVNGTSQYLSMPSAALPSSTISVSAWIYQTTNVNWYDLVSNNWGAGGAKGWDLYTDGSGILRFGLWQSGQSQYVGQCASGTFTTGTWHHAVGTYDGTTVRVYLDGAPCATTASVGAATLYTSGAWRIGEIDASVSPFIVDEVRLYNRALTAAEVQALYASPN